MRSTVLTGALLLMVAILVQAEPWAPAPGSYRPVTPADNPVNSEFAPPKTPPQTTMPQRVPAPVATPFYPHVPQFNPGVPGTGATRPYADNVAEEKSPFVKRESAISSDRRFRPPELKSTP